MKPTILTLCGGARGAVAAMLFGMFAGIGAVFGVALATQLADWIGWLGAAQ